MVAALTRLLSLFSPAFVYSDLLCLAARLDDSAGGLVGDTNTHQHHLAHLQARLDGLGDNMAGSPVDQSRGRARARR